MLQQRSGETLDPEVCRSVWQELLKSVFELDPLACPCVGRLRLRGLVRGVVLWKALAALGELSDRDNPCAPSPLPVERAGAILCRVYWGSLGLPGSR